MRKYLIMPLLVFFCSYFQSYSQEVLQQKFNPDEPFFFTPKNHDPNFKLAKKGSYKSFYQCKEEWQHIIDTTWGPGDSLPRKLLIFNTYAKAIHDKFDGLNSLHINWDSVYSLYLGQINESTSKGAFSSIMSHFALEFNDLHTTARDSAVVYTPLNPGVPLLLIGNFTAYEHFGAVTTILSDSSTLVLRAVPNHPLGLEPGDLILGYEGIPWKDLVKELSEAGLPMVAHNAGCKSAKTYQDLMGAGLNWHLFSTMDILKHSTGDTVHLSVAPMIGLNISPMINNEQLPVQGIPFPNIHPNELLNDTVITYGKLVGTNIGFIYLAAHQPTDKADLQFYNAINSLKNTDALIIDLRMNFGGWALFEKAFNLLFNEYHLTINDAYRCNANTFELCPGSHWNLFKINGLQPDFYDRPIAVLLGPSCASMGDVTAQRLRYHPMVKFFGASSNAVLGDNSNIKDFPGWILYYSISDMYHYAEPGDYLNRREFPIDYPVWFNKDDVAKGIDPVIEKSLEWINNLAYGHTIRPWRNSMVAGVDTARIDAFIENPHEHAISAQLLIESLDGSVQDSVSMSSVELGAATHWQAEWIVPENWEYTYWLSLKVLDSTLGTFFTNRHATRITSVPIGLYRIDTNKIAYNKFTVKPFLHNAGSFETIENIKLVLECTDPWVLSFTPSQTACPNLLPGYIKSPSQPYTIIFDTATYPGFFNLRFSISSNDWPYWIIDTTLNIETGINESVSNLYALDQNFPNPFSANSTLHFNLSEPEEVSLTIYNSLGQFVSRPVNGRKEAGLHEVVLNGMDMPAGVYFYQLQTRRGSTGGKFIVIH
jgi:hypothetical protein